MIKVTQRFDISRLILIFAVFLILYNAFTEIKELGKMIPYLKTHSYVSPGKEFVPLRPFLSQVPSAGYMSCYESSESKYDVNVMYYFQQAQFALSPTLLDYFNADQYSWIILYCSDRAKAQLKLKSLSAKPVVIMDNGVILAIRDLK